MTVSSETDSRPIKIYIIAGEASGDLLGAHLMRALVNTHTAGVSFSGIGGEAMEREGFKSSFPLTELAVMGITEVLPRIFNIMKRIRQTVAEIIALRPDVVITIDSPDFCFRVVRALKAQVKDIPCVHYVAPSVWAWRPGRAKKIAALYDHLLALLPFEPPYFEVHGLKTTVVGHPVVEPSESRGDAQRFRQKFGLKPDQPVLTMLPGSRLGEVSRLLERFARTADMLLQKRHDLVIAIPTLPHLRRAIDAFFVGRGINPIITTDMTDRMDCFAASHVAMAASGTVSLQLAIADTPHVIAYKLSPISTIIARKFIHIPYVNLVNILLKREVVPELLLERCEPVLIADALAKLIDSREARTAQLTDFRQALIMLGLGDPQTPGQKAAAAVLGVIAARSPKA